MQVSQGDSHVSLREGRGGQREEEEERVREREERRGDSLQGTHKNQIPLPDYFTSNSQPLLIGHAASLLSFGALLWALPSF